MGILNYIEDEPPLFGGILRAGYDPSSVLQSGQGNDVIPQYPPPLLIDASVVNQSGRPRVVIPGNRLATVEVTADRSPPTNEENSAGGIGKAFETVLARGTTSLINLPSDAQGLAKAFGSGVVKGATGLFGAPGDAIGLGKRALGYKVDSAPFLGSEHLQKLFETHVHELHKPEGTAEEAAETLGGFMPGFLLGEGALLGASKAATYMPKVAARVTKLIQAGQPSLTQRFLTRVVPPAALSEAAGQYYKGTDKEKHARMLGAFVGGSGAGLARAGMAGLPNGLWSAVYSNALRGALKAETAEGQDARRRREREAR